MSGGSNYQPFGQLQHSGLRPTRPQVIPKDESLAKRDDFVMPKMGEIRKFVNDALDRNQEIMDDMDQTIQNLQAFMNGFGSTGIEPEHFFLIFADFISIWKGERERREKLRRKEMEENEERKRVRKMDKK